MALLHSLAAIVVLAQSAAGFSSASAQNVTSQVQILCDNGDDCMEGLSCAHGAGGLSGPTGGDADASDDVLYPPACCDLTFTKTDRWCEQYVENGHRVKWEAQCASLHTDEDDDGNLICTEGALEGERCSDDGDDDSCAKGLVCGHGAWAFTGADEDADDEEDAVLYPYVCCPQVQSSHDDWCLMWAKPGEHAKYDYQCGLGTYARAIDNDDLVYDYSCISSYDTDTGALRRCSDDGDNESCRDEDRIDEGAGDKRSVCVHGPGAPDASEDDPDSEQPVTILQNSVAVMLFCHSYGPDPHSCGSAS